MRQTEALGVPRADASGLCWSGAAAVDGAGVGGLRGNAAGALCGLGARAAGAAGLGRRRGDKRGVPSPGALAAVVHPGSFVGVQLASCASPMARTVESSMLLSRLWPGLPPAYEGVQAPCVPGARH